MNPNFIKASNVYTKPCSSCGATDHDNSILCCRNYLNFVNLKNCSICGGTDHERSNSAKCPFFKVKLKKIKFFYL